MLAHAGIKVAVQGFPRPEADIENLWLDEAERRERAWDAGEVEAIPVEKVMRELRK
ncbi:MAG: addiction module protein [Thermoanaerobaculia bacterium]|nr:addiction module protein [Thermoanaerobaculia bacterium]